MDEKPDEWLVNPTPRRESRAGRWSDPGPRVDSLALVDAISAVVHAAEETVDASDRLGGALVGLTSLRHAVERMRAIKAGQPTGSAGERP